MKRQRSYSDDLSDDDKPASRDWSRRDADQDRPSSSHRRFYSSKLDSGRKLSSSSSYDRDDDREPLLPRPLRRRPFDHDLELDRLDRRKFSFDRYREGGSGGGERDRSLSSPRPGHGSCSGDRMRRSESFSLSRRDFPKGFRSERDRGRREGNSNGSSWRRSSSWKEFADEEVRSPAPPPSLLPLPSHSSVTAPVGVVAEPLGKGGSCLASESRSRSRSKDSPSGEPARNIEVKKPIEIIKERNLSSDMEEGELEPESGPLPHATSEPLSRNHAERKWETETKSRIRSEDASQSDVRTVSEEKLQSEEQLQIDAAEGASVHRDDKLSHDLSNPLLDSQTDEHQKPTEQDGVTVDLAKERTVTSSVITPPLTEVMVTGEDIAEVAQQHQASPNRESERTGKDNADENGQSVSCDSASYSLPETEGKHRAEPGTTVDSGEVVKEKSTAMENERDAGFRISQVELAVVQVEPVPGEGNENIDLEVKPKNAAGLFASADNASVGSKSDGVTLGLMESLSKDSCRDKGKSVAISPSDDANFAEEDEPKEGSSNRGFELIFLSNPSTPDKVSGELVIGNSKDDRLKLEPLDLSLGLPGILSDFPSQNLYPKPDSLPRVRSIQSLSCSFPSKSDGFTASISYSGSQSFFHNPSCCLTQNSAENYEHSVGSHPIFKGMEQVPDRTVQQGQLSSELIQKAEGAALYQHTLRNGNLSKLSPNVLHEHPYYKTNGLSQKSKSSNFLLSTHETMLERSEEYKCHGREMSSIGLQQSEQHATSSGLDVSNFKKVFAKMISEPFSVIGRKFQEMSEQSLFCLKKAVIEMIVNKFTHGELLGLTERLCKRSDFTPEVLFKCHRVLLEILVAIKTGVPHFLGRSNTAPSSDLVEIFLGMRCKNPSCGNILPVDDCDCKLCKMKSGFCSACMCLVCFNFDNAADTCSWVGCDFCCHWCHTDCALRHSHIRNSQLTHGITEMQFHCTACGRPSEMFDFVKEVFKTCAGNWKEETFAKELEFVRRIFSASEDTRGKRLHDIVNQLLLKLENNSDLSEVFNCAIEFFTENDMKLRDGPSTFLSKDVPRGGVSEEPNAVPVRDRAKFIGFSKELSSLVPSIPMEKSHMDIGSSVFPTLNSDRLGRHTEHVELRYAEKKHVDELDSTVKFKHEEARMYQSRADEARKEAESLKCIAIAKNQRIDEDYNSHICKLRLLESEERRRKKSEELQIFERTQNEYLNMKMKMESEIHNLLSKLEAVKHNLHS